MNCISDFLKILLITIFTLTGCHGQNENKNKKTPLIQTSKEVVNANPVRDNSFFEAAVNGQFVKIMKLLENGIDVNLKDQEGRTALMYAAFNGHTAIMEKLIEKGASVNLRDAYGRTALMLASSGPFPTAVKLLLDHRADPDMADGEEHFTALMYAAAEGQLEIVQILLKKKANPMLKDVDGDNALTFAEKNGHKDIVILLKSYLQ